MGKQTIFRTPPLGDHVTVSRHMAQDSRLSFDARGMLLYLLSKPPDWTVQLNDLRREGNIGRDKAKKIMAQLEQYGYIKKIQVRADGGKFDENEYQVYGTSQNKEQPLTENPSTDKPSTENPQLQSIEGTKQRKNNTRKRVQRVNPMFDMVKTVVWGMGTDETVRKTEAARIGTVASWLQGKSEGTKTIHVGKIASPAEPDDLTGFVTWYNRVKYPKGDTSLPRDIGKFAKHWREYMAYKKATTPDTDRSSVNFTLLNMGVNHDDLAA